VRTWRTNRFSSSIRFSVKPVESLSDQQDVTLLLHLLLVGRLAVSDESFEARLKVARANETSPAGRAYFTPLFDRLGPSLRDAMHKCFASSDAVGTRFTMIFAVRADGTLSRLAARPESPETSCVLRGIEAVQVAVPPRDDWWWPIDMKINP
jgi:hypothetical protein